MIVHLCSMEAWDLAVERGMYQPASLRTEGFIHCARTDQILAVANAFYRGMKDLVLLWINPDRLTARLLWEDPAHPERSDSPPSAGDRFPHIHGPLNVDAVENVSPFSPDSTGIFRTVPGGPTGG